MGSHLDFDCGILGVEWDDRKWSYSILRMNECILTLGEATTFSSADANCGYRRVEIEKADRNKAYFTSLKRLCHFSAIPFGLHKAPVTFHGTMDVILYSGGCQFPWSGFNDFIIFFKNFAQAYWALSPCIITAPQSRGQVQPEEVQGFSKENGLFGTCDEPGSIRACSSNCCPLNPKVKKGSSSLLSLCWQRILKRQRHYSIPW